MIQSVLGNHYSRRPGSRTRPSRVTSCSRGPSRGTPISIGPPFRTTLISRAGSKTRPGSPTRPSSVTPASSTRRSRTTRHSTGRPSRATPYSREGRRPPVGSRRSRAARRSLGRPSTGPPCFASRPSKTTLCSTRRPSRTGRFSTKGRSKATLCSAARRSRVRATSDRCSRVTPLSLMGRCSLSRLGSRRAPECSAARGPSFAAAPTLLCGGRRSYLTTPTSRSRPCSRHGGRPFHIGRGGSSLRTNPWMGDRRHGSSRCAALKSPAQHHWRRPASLSVRGGTRPR